MVCGVGWLGKRSDSCPDTREVEEKWYSDCKKCFAIINGYCMEPTSLVLIIILDNNEWNVGTRHKLMNMMMMQEMLSRGNHNVGIS